jgi:hypothetical protein
MNRLAALDSGTYYHHRTLYEERYRQFFDRIIYARALAEVPLDEVDILLVSCRTDPSLLVPHRAKFAQFLERGGSVVAMGSTGPHLWLPGVTWHDRPTNFWWWKEGGSLGLRCETPDHPLFERISLQDATWHYHGFFEPPQGARTLISASDGGAILYEDRVTTAGTMLVTSLDPMYHHGSYFMPATTRFLDGFLPYLKGGHRLAA